MSVLPAIDKVYQDIASRSAQTAAASHGAQGIAPGQGSFGQQGYPPPGGYPGQQGGYPPPGGYPQQQGGYYPPPGQHWSTGPGQYAQLVPVQMNANLILPNGNVMAQASGQGMYNNGVLLQPTGAMGGY